MIWSATDIALLHASEESRGAVKSHRWVPLNVDRKFDGYSKFTPRTRKADSVPARTILCMRRSHTTPEWQQREIRRRWPTLSLLDVYREIAP